MDCLNILKFCYLSPLQRGFFEGWGHKLLAIAVVERWPLLGGFNESKCMECRSGGKIVAIVER